MTRRRSTWLVGNTVSQDNARLASDGSVSWTAKRREVMDQRRLVFLQRIYIYIYIYISLRIYVYIYTYIDIYI